MKLRHKPKNNENKNIANKRKVRNSSRKLRKGNESQRKNANFGDE